MGERKLSQVYQLTFDDLENQKAIQSQPNRTAFIDECGNFGFDFSKEGTSKYYTLCAVVVEDSKLSSLHNVFNDVKKNNGFAGTEMKSSSIGYDNKRRSRIISQLLPIEFRVVVLISDKQAFTRESPLTEYKKSFIKFLHQRLYERLYHVYPKLKIIEDETGSTEFQESFKKYVATRRPQFNLFNEYDFDYCNSKDELLVQLADFVGGSINHSLIDPNAPNYVEMLKGKILLRDDFPSKKEPYWGSAKPEDYKYNSDIYALSVKCANDFIAKYAGDTSDEKRIQVAFLQYLLFHVQNISPFRYLYSDQIISTLQEYTEQHISRNYLYRHVIAPLRDEGVIITSSPRGYKIPISVDDIITYLNSTHTIVSPMLHRIDICRRLILQQTENSLDILDNPAFLRYKKYFD